MAFAPSITLSAHLIYAASYEPLLPFFVFAFSTFKTLSEHIHFAPRVLFFKRLSLSSLYPPFRWIRGWSTKFSYV